MNSQKQNDLWCLSWSHQHSAFQTESLDDHLSKNRKAYADARPGDHRVLLIDTKEEVERSAVVARNTLAQRRPAGFAVRR